MKRPPDLKRLDEMLRPSRISAHGFLGRDTRPVEEIIEADAATLARAGRTPQEVASRMREVTQAALAGQETTVRVGDTLDASAFSVRGAMPCPWPHPGRYAKTVTTARRVDSGETVRWSDLNVHMVECHGFFEGIGSPYRVDPEALLRVLF
jgi:hypothetical protein